MRYQNISCWYVIVEAFPIPLILISLFKLAPISLTRLSYEEIQCAEVFTYIKIILIWTTSFELGPCQWPRFQKFVQLETIAILIQAISFPSKNLSMKFLTIVNSHAKIGLFLKSIWTHPQPN